MRPELMTRKKRETLWERHFLRIQKARGVHGTDHVRAELDRLARQVRRLGENRSHQECDYTMALHHVLALIREAKV